MKCTCDEIAMCDNCKQKAKIAITGLSSPIPTSDTPRTDKIEYEQEFNFEVDWEEHSRKLERELNEAKSQLNFLESKGLTVGKMKTSDKPEPYLVYVCEPDSEFDDTIHVNKVINAEIERDQWRADAERLAFSINVVTNFPVKTQHEALTIHNQLKEKYPK